ncbi:protein FAM162A [Taeniopygia guttata]|uniref:Family with sequence similarity 162 member A n=1 Tax=Taeniopygia guttata TaxID=59729 RepID=A0A674HMM2_TAEGU|nr:protein FAM162A [Taeniopygia guttata]
MWGRADKAVKLLGRNIPSVLRMTEGVDPKISRRLCIKPQQDLQSKRRSASGVPGYKPTLWERRFLLWAGNFKKLEDIPETVSLDTVQAAKTNLRIKFSYVMIALTIVGCITMVIRGKQGMKRHESLTNINLEKKAQWKAEGASAKP